MLRQRSFDKRGNVRFGITDGAQSVGHVDGAHVVNHPVGKNVAGRYGGTPSIFAPRARAARANVVPETTKP